MELLINADAVEPFEAPVVYRPIRRSIRPSLSARAVEVPLQTTLGQITLVQALERSAAGRATLACMRWGMVIALVLVGYFGTELISRGIDALKAHPVSGTPPTVIATVNSTR